MSYSITVGPHKARDASAEWKRRVEITAKQLVSWNAPQSERDTFDREATRLQRKIDDLAPDRNVSISLSGSAYIGSEMSGESVSVSFQEGTESRMKAIPLPLKEGREKEVDKLVSGKRKRVATKRVATKRVATKKVATKKVASKKAA